MNRENLLKLVPVRCAEEIGRIDECARVEFPRFRSAFGRLFGKLFRSSETIKLTLDDKCTAVWDIIDGRRNVESIGAKLKARYGDDIEPLYERLGELLGILAVLTVVAQDHVEHVQLVGVAD